MKRVLKLYFCVVSQRFLFLFLHIHIFVYNGNDYEFSFLWLRMYWLLKIGQIEKILKIKSANRDVCKRLLFRYSSTLQSHMVKLKYAHIRIYKNKLCAHLFYSKNIYLFHVTVNIWFIAVYIIFAVPWYLF